MARSDGWSRAGGGARPLPHREQGFAERDERARARLPVCPPPPARVVAKTRGTTAPATQRNGGALDGARFGCAHALNRFYMGDQQSGLQLADLVLSRAACTARVLGVEESTRPVTGARRLVVHIVGEETVALDDDLAPSEGGFLVGRARPADGDAARAGAWAVDARVEGDGGERAPECESKVVCVVGLAHANGVLDRCAQSDLQLALLESDRA